MWWRILAVVLLCCILPAGILVYIYVCPQYGIWIIIPGIGWWVFVFVVGIVRECRKPVLQERV